MYLTLKNIYKFKHIRYKSKIYSVNVDIDFNVQCFYQILKLHVYSLLPILFNIILDITAYVIK